ncbi:MAG: hypothetical protein C0467_08860 [Planctomycetaceae bacterium]|nr:hypothetical protein [Planctomycetaceae bacterium]
MRIRRAGAVVLALLATVVVVPEANGRGAARPPAKAEPAFAWRKEAERAKFLKDVGGTEDSEKAVALGLLWLARQQKSDGGWEFDAGDKAERVAATGLAVLTFLGAGETHTDKGKYQKTVEMGIAWLIKGMPLKGGNAGKLSGNAYAQGIGALALVEAYAVTRDEKIEAAAQAAVDYIIKAQAANGSWGYSPGSAGDTSITGWQVQALRVAQLTKTLLLPAATLKKCGEFLDTTAGGKQKAVYGYIERAGAAPGTSLTAVGLLCRHHLEGWGPKHEGMAEGVTGLVKRARNTTPTDSYFLYYASQVVRNFGGEEWETWNEGPKADDGTRKGGGVRDTLIGLQDKKPGPNQGSFPADAGYIGKSCGRLGTTCMYLMTLEVYYRYSSK